MRYRENESSAEAGWFKAVDRLPEIGDDVEAVILYDGAESVVQGKGICGNNEGAYADCVLFDFYRDKAAERIVRWRPLMQASRAALSQKSADRGSAEELVQKLDDLIGWPPYTEGLNKSDGCAFDHEQAIALIEQDRAQTASSLAERADILEVLLRHVCNCWMGYQKAKYLMYEKQGDLAQFAMENMPASEGALLDACCAALGLPWRNPVSEIDYEADNAKLSEFMGKQRALSTPPSDLEEEA